MSPIGRIFIVLNLILAGLFLGWASQVVDFQQDYRQQLSDEQAAHTATREQLEAELSDARTQLNQAKDDKRLALDEAQTAKDRSTSLEGQLATTRNDFATAQALTSKNANTIAGFKDTIEALDRDKSKAVDAAHSAESERDAAMDEAKAAEFARRDAEDALAEAEAAIVELEIALVDTVRLADSLETQLATLVDVTGVSLPMIAAQPLIEGAVLGTRLEIAPGLVALNVGSNQGVTRGMTFDIYSGDTYKGKVRIESVQPDKSSALVTLPRPGTTIGQGDRATTRL